MKKILVLIATALLSFQLFADGKVTIKISEVRNSEGHILIAMVNIGDPSEVYAESIQAREGIVEYTFADVEEGTYMVVLFHDEDDNEDMAMDAQGMPQEGIGMLPGGSIMNYPPMLEIEGPETVIEMIMTYDFGF